MTNVKRRKVLVTGASGLLGRTVFRAFRERGDWECIGSGFRRVQPPLYKVDLLQREAVEAFVLEHRPSGTANKCFTS
jgi:nucleoside-diphosphate-sugar epimerase